MKILAIVALAGFAFGVCGLEASIIGPKDSVILCGASGVLLVKCLKGLGVME